MLEDYNGLEKMVNTLPENHALLSVSTCTYYKNRAVVILYWFVKQRYRDTQVDPRSESIFLSFAGFLLIAELPRAPKAPAGGAPYP